MFEYTYPHSIGKSTKVMSLFIELFDVPLTRTKLPSTIVFFKVE